MAAQSGLVDHAIRELALIGEDEWMTEGIVKVMRAFSEGGHSGGSAFHAIPIIEKLLRYEPLSDLTDREAAGSEETTPLHRSVTA